MYTYVPDPILCSMHTYVPDPILHYVHLCTSSLTTLCTPMYFILYCTMYIPDPYYTMYTYAPDPIL